MIAANDQIIADLKATIQHDKKAAKADYKSKVSALEQKNAEMKKKMKDYRQDGKDKWQAFKTEFTHDMDELGKAFKDLHASSLETNRAMATMTKVPMTIIKTGRIITAMAAGTARKNNTLTNPV